MGNNGYLFRKTGGINKFGRNPDIDTASDPEDIWDAGGLWVPPTLARIHNIKSSSIEDSGDTLSSGTATGGSLTTLIDSSADFSADGVTAGDVVLNDTTMEHSVVISVTATTLTLHKVRHNTPFLNGHTYRIVNADFTGMSILHVIGLGSDMKEQEEFVVMNGTSNVATVKTYWRIFRMHTDGAPDRTVSNVGTVTATAVTDATVTAQINPGNGQTLMAVYTVPAGKTAYMSNFSASINKSGGATSLADISLRETPFASTNGSGSRLKHVFGLASDGTSSKQHFFKPYKKFLEQTDIWIRCEVVSKDNTDISAGFDLILLNE